MPGGPLDERSHGRGLTVLHGGKAMAVIGPDLAGFESKRSSQVARGRVLLGDHRQDVLLSEGRESVTERCVSGFGGQSLAPSMRKKG